MRRSVRSGDKGRRAWNVGSLLCAVAVFSSAAPVRAREGGHSRSHTDVPSSPSFFNPASDPNRPRSDIFSPIVSFILPGFDQWWEGQYGSAAIYSGAAIGGYVYANATSTSNHYSEHQQQLKDEADRTGNPQESELDQKDITGRKVVLGELIAQGAGGMSAYQAFRTAVRTRQGHGQYEFLTHEETPLDIMAAPFHFSYMTRPTTYIPLAIGAGLAYLVVQSGPPDGMVRDGFSSADGFFTGAYSYNAGMHEEAIFRGWLMPVMREYWDSDFWSNAAQSVLFAAAHLNTNPQPLPQLLLGYDLGWISQNNGWRISEGVFIHTWWDVLAFASQYAYKQKAPAPVAAKIHPILWLPPVALFF